MSDVTLTDDKTSSNIEYHKDVSKRKVLMKLKKKEIQDQIYEKGKVIKKCEMGDICLNIQSA